MKYYIGFTSDIEKRLLHHNSGQNRWSKTGVPWTVVHFIEVDSRSEAINLEKKLKNIGAERFLKSKGMLM